MVLPHRPHGKMADNKHAQGGTWVDPEGGMVMTEWGAEQVTPIKTQHKTPLAAPHPGGQSAPLSLACTFLLFC